METEEPNPAKIKLVGDGVPTAGSSMLDFWQWAFGDLCDDDLKGVFAEWMVGKLLNLPTERRVSWADSDVIGPGGVWIEVKASAHWQSWTLVNEDGSPKPYDGRKPGSISFSGLQARTSITPAPEDSRPGFKSHIYVFCHQTVSGELKPTRNGRFENRGFLRVDFLR